MGSEKKSTQSSMTSTWWRYAFRILLILSVLCGAMTLPPAKFVRAIGLGPRAFLVYGQNSSFVTNTANNGGINASSLSTPYKTLLDSSGDLYVSDSGNNRVLYYPAGSTTATRVYGQAGSFSTATANNGGISPNSLSQPKGLALDSNGNLYVDDSLNNRILYYPAGSTTATRVYGQAGSFTTATANNGGITASSLNAPSSLTLDGNNNLYVADSSNNRVLYFPATTTTATRVYGQSSSFSTNTANNGGVSANSLSTPSGIALDSSSDLYVTDTKNSRVLYFPATTTTATNVYGQSGSFSTNTANNAGISASSLNNPASVTLDSSGNIYIADDLNNRLLYFPAGSTTATRVYGQANSFSTNSVNYGGLDATSLMNPKDVIVDSNGNIYVADANNNRVLKFQTNLIITTQPPTAIRVNTSFTLRAGLGDVGSNMIFADFTGKLSVAIKAGSGSSSAILGGITSVATTSGVANFSNLTINTANSGYSLTVSSPGLLPTNTNTFIVTGPLFLTYLTSPSFTFNLTGTTSSSALPYIFKVNDATQLGLGWHLNITSTQWTTTSGNTLPTTATTITGVSTACTTGQTCTLPTNGITGYPITVPAATTAPAPITYYSASKGTGIGDVTITTTIALNVAPGTPAGTYSSTITETLVDNPAAIYSINSGGPSAGTFIADNLVSGGSSYIIGPSIDTSAVTNPAPQAVYQSERYGNFTYTLPALVPGAQYTVRLHFAEIYWTSIGQRIFNVSINGVQVLTNFDIIAATGGIDKAVVEQFTTTANASGQIVIVYTTIVDNAKSSGIEVIAN